MTVNGERDLSRMGPIDFGLMGLGTCLAAYSGGMAIDQPAISWFAIAFIVVGTLVSYFARTALLKSSTIKIDGFLYAAGLTAAFVFGNSLQGLLPGEGFPREVAVAGALTWMLIIGSFFTWQDSTLLFQAVPTIAMFGLVGCYDTFPGVKFAFFGFLTALATLFSRAHRRAMLRQAADSGFFTRGLAPGTPTPSVDTTPGLARQMESGPWRWIAGPEWALGSAVAVVLVSLLGAPYVRESVSGVSGFVKVVSPRLYGNRNNPLLAAGMPTDPNGGVRVGRGPNRLTNEPVFEMQMDRARYLRQLTFDTYTGHGWRSAVNTNVPIGAPLVDVNEMGLKGISVRAQDIPFHYRSRKPMRVLPVPGELLTLGGEVLAAPDGHIDISRVADRNSLDGIARAAIGFGPGKANLDIPHGYESLLSVDRIPARVRDFALDAMKGAKTDRDRAEQIRAAIAKRIVYNIGAEAPPADQDPVEYTLFTEKQAYCDIYASAMTMMARVAGIPSRYAVGYLPDDEERDAAGNYVVLESDLHAWAELYFEGEGWVVFDATAGADAVPGNGRGTATDQGPFFERPWVKTTIDVLLGLGALVGVTLLFRGASFGNKDAAPQSELERTYVSFSTALERSTKIRRDISRTPDEFFSQVRPKLNGAGDLASDMNARFVRLMYSKEGASAEDVAKLRADLRNLRRMLRDTAGRK